MLAGRYRILAQLAEGGMGVTFRAWDAEGQRLVVVKQPKRPRNDPDGKLLDDRVERFRREIKAMQFVRHPHVVPVIDSGDDDELPFIVMRLLPGGSLAERRRRKSKSQYYPLPPGHLHRWLPGVASALDHIHSHGMMHRDVKPTNIFFDADGRAFLGDFGIAKPLDSLGAETGETLTATHITVGTPEYMAPELNVPGAKRSGAVDQYALAITVYEVISGGRPFSGLLGQSIIVEHATAMIPPLDRDLPSSLRIAIEHGLAKKPEDRFSTCREFAAAVLKGVTPLVDKVAVKRLLCPNPDCHKLLVMPGTEGGKRGSCPSCHIPVEMSDDGTALLLQSEVESIRPKGRPKGGFFDNWDFESWCASGDLGEIDPEITAGTAKTGRLSVREVTVSLAIRLRENFWLVASALGVTMTAVRVAISALGDPIVGRWICEAGTEAYTHEFMRDGRIRGHKNGWWKKGKKLDGNTVYVIYWPMLDERGPSTYMLEMKETHKGKELKGTSQEGRDIRMQRR